MITNVATRLTIPRPSPRPPRLCDTPSQSANEAPSGRVTIYANQKARIEFMPSRQWATAGMAITTANMTPEARKPRWKVTAVRSPKAVPSANVAITVAQ